MTICNESKSYYCLNACCYIQKKRVYSDEVKQIGLENIVRQGDDYLLKNKDSFGACVFLNEEEGKCDIYEKRPYNCKTYTCFGYLAIELFAQEIAYYRKKQKANKK